MATLDLLSWNLNGLDDRDLDARSEAAVQLALLGRPMDALVAGASPRPLPDVLVFQEVVTRSYYAHLGPHLSAAGFRLWPARAPDRNYFELIAVRAPWEVVRYESAPLYKSRYGRWQHRLDLKREDAKLAVFTAHLDSGPQATKEREAQVRDLARQMREPSMFAGDTNLRQTEWRRAQRGLNIRDAWEALGKDESTRWTWAGHGKKARFDRVWLSAEVKPRTLESIGTFGPGAPSDHCGLRVTIEI